MSLKIIPMRFVSIPKEILKLINTLYADKECIFVESFDNEEFHLYHDNNRTEFISSISLEKEFC